MTKEQLVELGLDDKQIGEVFKLNGIAVNKAKGEFDTVSKELEDTKEQVDQANKKIESFKDLDIEGIKQASEEYKLKYEQAQEESTKQLEAIKFNHELEQTARDFKSRNVKATLALLDTEALRESNNRSEDIKKAFETLATENDFLFEVAPQANDDDQKPNFSRPNNGGGDVGITQEQFKGMSYTERVKLKDKEPKQYDRLTK